MVNRFAHHVARGIPVRSAAVYQAHTLRVFAFQHGVQEGLHQWVVAIPLAAGVERFDEQVALFEFIQQCAAILTLKHGVAQISVERVEWGGEEQEGAHRFRLLHQHFLREIVNNVMVVAFKRIEQALDVACFLQRKRRQVQRCRPAIGAGFQRRHHVIRQVQPHDFVEKRAGFFDGEAQISGAQFADTVAHAPARQRQWGVAARGQHHMHIGRLVFQPEGERTVYTRMVDKVVIVKHQDDGLAEVEQDIEHIHHEGVLVERLGGFQPMRHLCHSRPMGAQRLHHIRPKPHRLVVGFVNGEPGDGLAAFTRPMGKQGGFAIPRGRRNQRDGILHSGVECIEQARAHNQCFPRGGNAPFGCQ